MSLPFKGLVRAKCGDWMKIDSRATRRRSDSRPVVLVSGADSILWCFIGSEAARVKCTHGGAQEQVISLCYSWIVKELTLLGCAKHARSLSPFISCLFITPSRPSRSVEETRWWLTSWVRKSSGERTAHVGARLNCIGDQVKSHHSVRSQVEVTTPLANV